MIIGINTSRLIFTNRAGPETYLFNLISTLSKIDQINRYVLYFKEEPYKETFNDLVNHNPNFSYKVIKNKFSWTHFGLAYELQNSPVDVFFTSDHTLPLFVPKNLKVIAMIHGLEYKTNKICFLKKILLKVQIDFIVKRANKIITPSNYTKEKITSHVKVENNKINVIAEGVSSNFYKRSLEEIEAAKTKYKIKTKSYLLFISTIQPRKNLPKLIEGFSLAIKELSEPITLVVSGKLGWQFNESLEAPKKFGVDGNVSFIGRSNDEDLPALLSGATAYISASIDEGFGLTLLEALACETLSIVSDIPAFKELGKEIPIYIDPKSSENIKEGITQAINNKDLDYKKIEGKLLAKDYSWEKTAKATLSLFESLVKNS